MCGSASFIISSWAVFHAAAVTQAWRVGGLELERPGKSDLGLPLLVWGIYPACQILGRITDNMNNMVPSTWYTQYTGGVRVEALGMAPSQLVGLINSLHHHYIAMG